jgi:BirA family transcriptional regulator, biotin operon repressor / biotin---[acetyl-CoA-carboxylase] ligase
MQSQKYKHLSVFLQTPVTIYNLNANLCISGQIDKYFSPAFTNVLIIMIIGSRKIFIEKLSSTNSHAALLLRKGKVQEGTVVYTGFQTAGRGQGTNNWESEPGKNLLFSIIIYPYAVKADSQFSISRMISLGIKDFLSTIIRDVFIKWPNDIYAGNDKIAGILIENAIIRNDIEHTIAGIGININQERFTKEALNSTSLKILTGKEYDTEECLTGVLRSTDLRYRELSFGKKSKINSDYLSSLYLFDRWSEFRDNRGTFEGKIIEVTGTGRLQIEDRKGRIYEFDHKEVDFL